MRDMEIEIFGWTMNAMNTFRWMIGAKAMGCSDSSGRQFKHQEEADHRQGHVWLEKSTRCGEGMLVSIFKSLFSCSYNTLQ